MEAKRQRTTNPSQFSTMVENMKKHRDIATNMTKKPPDAVLQFWDSLASELNNLGPPCKSVAEWKKVWSDYKSGIKKKLVHNKREQNGTGGGLNKQMFLSSLEEEVVDMTSMHTIVEGLNKVTSYGVPGRGREQDEVPFSSKTVDDIPPTSRAHYGMDVGVEEGQVRVDEESPGDDPRPSFQSRCREPKQLRLLEKQVKINEEHLHNYMKATEETNNNLRKISRNLEKLHDDAKKTNGLISDFIDETRSHNAIMQKLAYEKNELKKQILQIELEKCNL